jgi:hypothetical protein
MRHQKLFLLALLSSVVIPIHARAAEPEPKRADIVPFAGFDGPKLLLAPNPDGGDPPAFSLSKENPRSGEACLKLTFRVGSRGWGNLQMPLWLTGAEEAVTFHVRRESANPKATLFIWLFEDDGDAWLSRRTLVSELGDGWQQITLKLSDFRFQPRGDGKQNLRRVNKLLIGCNYADFTVDLDDFAFVGEGIAARRKAMGAPANRLVYTITPEQAVRGPFLGLGAQWNPYRWIDVPEEDWRKIEERVRWMRLPVARVMILSRWFVRDDGTYDWNANGMKRLYRILDICQKMGTTVFLTEWGCARIWNRVPGVKGNDDPKYAKIIAAHVDHLINQKKYTCITHLVFVNEPNLEAGGYGVWKRGFENVVKELAARGLDKKIAMMGCDATGAWDWHRNSVRDLKGSIGAYDLHLYANDSEVGRGALENTWRGLWDYALQHDPAAKDKPFVVGEAGMRDGMSTAKNTNIATYRYGMFMADYAVQALRGKTSSVVAWMLDDNSHKDFAWGAWSNSDEGLELRPWFYPWALLCRYLPVGSTVYRPDDVPGRAAQVRTLAARSPKGKWTFCVVNREMVLPASVLFRVPDGTKAEFRRYLYTETGRLADDRGFPVPVGTEAADLAEGLAVKCPPNSVVVVTSVAITDPLRKQENPE